MDAGDHRGLVGRSVRSALWIAVLAVLCVMLLRYFVATGVPRVALRRERVAARALYVIPAMLMINGRHHISA